MASEVEFIPLLLGMGLTTLSLSPPMIPEIKNIIRSVSIRYCEAIAQKALSFDTSKQTINFFRDEKRKILSFEI